MLSLRVWFLDAGQQGLSGAQRPPAGRAMRARTNFCLNASPVAIDVSMRGAPEILASLAWPQCPLLLQWLQ